MLELNVIPTPSAEVTLTDWDVILVNTSGGKDSMAMADLVVRMAEKAGVKDRVVFVHADLGRAEWEGVKDLVKEHAAHYGVRLEIVHRTQNDLIDHVRARGKWPASNARYCTSDHKRGPIRKVMTQLAREFKESTSEARPCRILNCMGLRAEESPARNKKATLALSSASNKTVRKVYDWLPIHGWTTGQVWDRIRESGLRHHKAYDLGMPRLSCVFCIFAPKSALVLAGKNNPELLDTYVEVEEEIGHTFRKDLSLAEVRDEALSGQEVGAVNDWRM